MRDSDGFELIAESDIDSVFKVRKSALDDGFCLLNMEQMESLAAEEFERLWKSAGPLRNDSRHKLRDKLSTNAHRPICFIDGEGANVGEPIVTERSTPGLFRVVQRQNYALLGAVLQDGEYVKLVSENGTEPLTTRQCLDFILDLPANHIIVGYYLVYDVEKWLSDLPEKYMERLIRTNRVFWKRYRIHYIPTKLFQLSVRSKGNNNKGKSRTVYDISGFFQRSFQYSIDKWKVATPTEQTFIEKMKAARPQFSGITEETMEYNKAEGILGIRLFERVRSEYTKLGLRLPRPVGAGSIASAMFRANGVGDYYPTFQSLPTEIMCQGFIGGRFDISKIGLCGDTYQYDINSAYPHIARNLPCLAHSRFEWSNRYVENPNSLWLVRWSDNDNRWSPFPYRSDTHIRYYSGGCGYYYGSEVASALRLDSDISILGGYHFICECEHRPFKWIEDYYLTRQEMLRNKDFAEQIIKLGLNSIYGKLAETRSQNPRFQNLIWAGMITSGTRAMLLDAIAQSPESILACATDAVISTVPLRLDTNPTRLGAWKESRLDNLLLLGNGIYQSENGVERSRGVSKLDWEKVRADYLDHGTHVATKYEFIAYAGAKKDRRLHERGSWLNEDVEMKFQVPFGKTEKDGWIWPGVNPFPLIPSMPAKIRAGHLRVAGVSQNAEVVSDSH